jgi:hypothetical protein
LVAALATLFGLLCMEAEYWFARGFPQDEVPFFLAAVAITLAGLALGKHGTFALGGLGLAFFAYVNLRYGAPYLLDYVMPVLYAVLLALSRRELHWWRPGLLAVGRLEALGLLFMNIVMVWRTTTLDKWGWLAGQAW